MKNTLYLLLLCLTVSAAALGTWASTGQDWYTKFQVVEIRRQAVAEDDPFAQTGLYEGDGPTRAEKRDEFRLGLLPAGLDEHLLSVSTVVLPLWLACAVIWLRGLRRTQPNQ